MRHYLKKLIIVFISLYVAYSLIPTISLGNEIKNLLLIIAGFFVAAVFIKPFFSLVLVPINFLTVSFVSLALNIAIIFALINFLPGVNVSAYHFPGANLSGVIIEPLALNRIATIFTIALIITITQKALHLIFE